MSSASAYQAVHNIAVYIPLVGISTAASFDVGYFWAVDINYFNLFSFSEHVVFAIQAIPAILLMAIIAFSGFLIIRLFPFFVAAGRENLRLTMAIYVGLKKAFSILVRRRASEEAPQAHRRRIKGRMMLLRAVRFMKSLLLGVIAPSFLVLLMITFVPFLIENVFPKANYILAWLVAVFLITLVLLFGERKTSKTIYLAGCLVIFMSFSFVAGYQHASVYITQPVALHKIKKKGSDEITGRVIRSGERGVLMVDSGRRIVLFTKWDTIEGIETVRNVD